MTCRELSVRVTHMMLAKGYTFDQQKIAAIIKKRKQREVDEFIAKAQAFWKKQSN